MKEVLLSCQKHINVFLTFSGIPKLENTVAVSFLLMHLAQATNPVTPNEHEKTISHINTHTYAAHVHKIHPRLLHYIHNIRSKQAYISKHNTHTPVINIRTYLSTRLLASKYITKLSTNNCALNTALQCVAHITNTH